MSQILVLYQHPLLNLRCGERSKKKKRKKVVCQSNLGIAAFLKHNRTSKFSILLTPDTLIPLK